MKRKKSSAIIRRILIILIIICLAASGFFLYQYMNSNDTQFKNAAVRLVEADKIIKDKKDIRKEKIDIGKTIGKVKLDGLTDWMPIIEGDDLNKSMMYGVGHIQTTPMPGTYSGQPTLSAHRETFFKPLQNAKNGSIITVQMPYGTYQYKISKSIIVNPNEAAKVYSNQGMINKERLILITCYPFNPFSNPSQRIIYYADIITPEK
jgi:sortase A